MRLLNELGRAPLDAGSIARHPGSNNARTLALTTGLGAASSSCSYAAVALARALVRRPHHGAQPAQLSLQTQMSDHQNRIAVPSMGMAPAPRVRSSD